MLEFSKVEKLNLSCILKFQVSELETTLICTHKCALVSKLENDSIVLYW